MLHDTLSRRAAALLLATAILCSLPGVESASRLPRLLSSEAAPRVTSGDEVTEVLNNRPLVGIVSQGALLPNQSYIAASYVKFIEMAGGRAVPFTHDMTEDEIAERFNQVNGILLPGGGAILEPGYGYYDVSATLLRLAIEANDRGDFFPILGTCLGFEFFTVAISGNTSILGNFDSGNVATRLEFTSDAALSRTFSTFRPELLQLMTTQPLTQENHQFAISPQVFTGDAKLSQFFQVLSTSKDKQGVEYVSSVEARQYPIIATQWHAEKNAFEWASTQQTPHSAEAVEVTFSLARSLLNMARRNLHKPRDIESELDLLIYNYPVTIKVKKITTRLQSCATWTKKSSKGWTLYADVCARFGKAARTFITPMKTRFTNTECERVLSCWSYHHALKK
eukprot:jgi/Tetstr1/460800/TSEL_000556.t1